MVLPAAQETHTMLNPKESPKRIKKYDKQKSNNKFVDLNVAITIIIMDVNYI